MAKRAFAFCFIRSSWWPPLLQSIQAALQRGRQVPGVPRDRRAVAKTSGLSSEPLLVPRRLDRHERYPLGLAASVCRLELSAQPVLPRPIHGHDVPTAHIAKARGTWRSVVMEIMGGGCEKKVDGWI